MDTRVKPAHDTGVCGEFLAPHRISKFQTATRLQSRGANGVRGVSIPTSPPSRGRAERRVPVAPLGLMRMRSSARICIRTFGGAGQGSARRSARGVFSVACTSALAIDPHRHFSVPRAEGKGSLKRVIRTRFELVVRHMVQRVFPSQGRPSPDQWQVWPNYVLPEDRRSP
jgi:hypothetical protein